MAAKTTHPDRTGTREHWDEVQEAKAVIETHFHLKGAASV